MTGIEMTHVPYKGSVPALTDVIAGHIPLMFVDLAPAQPMIKGGKVRALGVSSAVRVASLPDVAPIAEVGVPGFEAVAWQMLVAPANTPKQIVDTRARRRGDRIGAGMSAIGTKRNFPLWPRMSAFGGKADIPPPFSGTDGRWMGLFPKLLGGF
jgi:hypothetical protein